MDQQSLEYSPPEAGLVKGDDPIDAINHMMSFLTAVVTFRVTVKPIQGRQNSLAAGTSRPYTSGPSGKNSRKQRTVVCYNYKGEGHMSKQCTKPKRKGDEAWFKDKVLLVQPQADEQILHEEDLEFLADPGIAEAQTTHYIALIANLSHYRSNNLAEREESQNIDRELALEKQVKELNNIVFKRNQSAQTIHMLTKPQFFYDHSTRQAFGFQNPCYLKKAQQLEPKLYDGSLIQKTDTIVIRDSKETLMLKNKSRSKMLQKQKDPIMSEKKVNTKPESEYKTNRLCWFKSTFKGF
nr:hypothetical protein [Tanacetum cinerariifolium]